MKKRGNILKVRLESKVSLDVVLECFRVETESEFQSLEVGFMFLLRTSIIYYITPKTF